MSNLNSTPAKTRNQSPAVAKRKMLRAVMKRARAIAQNALNFHNSSIQRVAQFGAAENIGEFFSEALKIAWAEYRTGETIYENRTDIPRKKVANINETLAIAVKSDRNNNQISDADKRYNQAVLMLNIRSAKEPTQEEINLAHAYAYDHGFDLNYALTA